MKYSRQDVCGKSRQIQTLSFEDQSLTSFSGLVVFQKLFANLDLKAQLKSCFRHLSGKPVYAHHLVVLLLVIQLLLGYRELRDIRFFSNDPLVKRLLGWKRLPDEATVSRALSKHDEASVENLRSKVRAYTLDRIGQMALARLTLDFDGSVQSTGKYAEGTAVGFNKKKKGARSYYPLFCTVAQTGQVLDVYHRPGNVHDSNGAKAFISQSIDAVRAASPGVRLETRKDSAFFNEDVVDTLDEGSVEFTISVPFERFTELKAMINSRKRWRRLDQQTSYFETNWKPKSWGQTYRFLFVRQRVAKQRKGPVKLDLFAPQVQGYEFKVVVTNKIVRAKKVVAFHNGRGAQENIFAELKSHNQMGYVPTKKLCGNQVYLFAAVLAHNLTRELQMQAFEQHRRTTEKRAPLWIFQKLDTIRRNFIQRAGRITRPNGKLKLTIDANEAVQRELVHFLDALEQPV
ncbi:MAG: IS1380 family transposase [Gammaproteobacteria bacterium]|nr:MAG: IS1380 family transposase [Gammaproteobacteria bacterium]